MIKLIFIALVFSAGLFKMAGQHAAEPVVTAEKYIAYKKETGLLKEFIPPKIVLICYQQSTLKYLLAKIPEMKLSDSFSNLYLMDGGEVGILGGWGLGAPAFSVKMEELIALGVKKFVAVGTAGTLLNRYTIGDFIVAPKALAEDGVAHLYMKGESFAEASEELVSFWSEFAKGHSLPNFHKAVSWSFSAIFRETPGDICRVAKKGCEVVEMEAATLYAIGHEKGVQTLSLFVVSDSIGREKWSPRLKDSSVQNNLHKLAEWALQFCRESSADK